MEETLESLLKEEVELQFTRFNEDTAWQIGSQLVEEATKRKLRITIDITRGEQQLFHASRPGTSADNDEWIKRKTRLVRRFGHSSLYMGKYLKSKHASIEEKYLISEREYGPHGGCFPVMIKGSGMIGTITVSGMTQEEDHALVVGVIRAYLETAK